MSAEFMQYLLSGITIGAIYALVALGFSIIFNASHVINFAQGEFVMIGGMTTASLIGAGARPLPQSLWVLGVTLAIVLALSWFFGRTLLGKAILATSHQRLAAQLVGINVRR